MALPSSTSPAETLLRRIATLLSVLVVGVLTMFGYYASSICITVVLAGFLAILFDPVVIILEKLHLPRGLGAAVVVLAGMSLIGLLGHELYGRSVIFAEELPVYTSKIQQTIEPIRRKIQKVQEGYFGAVDRDSEDRILRPASVYCPRKRTVAIASKETGTHIPPSCANCRVI